MILWLGKKHWHCPCPTYRLFLLQSFGCTWASDLQSQLVGKCWGMVWAQADCRKDGQEAPRNVCELYSRQRGKTVSGCCITFGNPKHRITFPRTFKLGGLVLAWLLCLFACLCFFFLLLLVIWSCKFSPWLSVHLQLPLLSTGIFLLISILCGLPFCLFHRNTEC